MWLGLFILAFTILLFQLAKWDELQDEFFELKIKEKELKDELESDDE